jgi:hypothetical protein
LSGTKYIARTEILFTRVDPHIFFDRKLNQNENYNKMIVLYKQTWDCEANNEKDNFVDTYFQALKIQRSAFTGPLAKDHIKKVPRMLWLKIFQLLDLNSTCSVMCVNKSFYGFYYLIFIYLIFNFI